MNTILEAWKTPLSVFVSWLNIALNPSLQKKINQYIYSSYKLLCLKMYWYLNNTQSTTLYFIIDVRLSGESHLSTPLCSVFVSRLSGAGRERNLRGSGHYEGVNGILERKKGIWPGSIFVWFAGISLLCQNYRLGKKLKVLMSSFS